MNPIKEAAQYIHAAEKRSPGVAFRMDVSHKYVHITGQLGEFELSRSVTWSDIDDALMNPLTITLAAIENELKAAIAA